MEVALKIDVDTHRGLEIGVPRLVRALRDERVTASFYIAMGPDNSGRAILRAFKNRGFVKKMFRTRAVSMYGARTILSGTILPARPIALALPDIVRALKRDNFEVGVHGYDHVRWQDKIDRLGEEGIRAELEDAFEAYRAIFHEPSRAFAAPGWRTNSQALDLLDTMGLRYRSDTRGREPFRCFVSGRVLATPEIPTTLPTLDEVMGRNGFFRAPELARFYLERMNPYALNVHTIHAETEGMGQLELFVAIVRELRDRGASFVRMEEVAARLKPERLPICEVVRSTLEGRAGWISAQGPAAS
ncbi:MAG: polysaccharide deacetylase family protein [Candidatus Binataceae bacterium]